MLTSYTFRPRISIRSRNATIDSTFVCPSYRGRVAFNYRVLYIAAFYAFIAFFQRCFYLISTYLTIYIVDLHLYQQPSSLYRYRGAIPARRRFSAQYYSSFRISYSLSTTYRRKVSQLIGLGVVPLQVAFAPLVYLSIQRISFSIRWSYTINTLYIAVTSIYTSSSETTTLRSSIARSILLQAPIILYRYQFYSFLRGARELFTNSLPLRPIPQIQAPYSIIGLTTTIYSSRVRLKEGPQVNATIYNTAIKAATPLQVIYIIYAFQFSFIFT